LARNHLNLAKHPHQIAAQNLPAILGRVAALHQRRPDLGKVCRRIDSLRQLPKDAIEVRSEPDVIDALKQQGITATPSTPDELRARIERDVAKWKKLAQETGITME